MMANGKRFYLLSLVFAMAISLLTLLFIFNKLNNNEPVEREVWNIFYVFGGASLLALGIALPSPFAHKSDGGS